MGTRAQVKINGVFLYQHWDGRILFQTVKTAIAKKLRWDDPDYLTRIIFCEMIKDNVTEETGYGIGTKQAGDIEYLVTVDCRKQTITETKIYNKKETTIKFEDC